MMVPDAWEFLPSGAAVPVWTWFTFEDGIEFSGGAVFG